MPISFLRSVSAKTCKFALLFSLVGFPASQAIGQESATQTALLKQLNRIDFAITATGLLSTRTSGVEQRDANTTHSVLSIRPSSTVGELGTIRYTAKPWVGFEFNVSNGRFVQNYTFTPQPTQNILAGGAQTGVRELTFGYVAHLPWKPFGIQPYAGAGGGTIHFTPTRYGGQGLPPQYRAAYYYHLGLEDNFPGSHFGMRVGFRQLIYLDPDFLQNYLTITKRVRTSEPQVGFFVRF